MAPISFSEFLPLLEDVFRIIESQLHYFQFIVPDFFEPLFINIKRIEKLAFKDKSSEPVYVITRHIKCFLLFVVKFISREISSERISFHPLFISSYMSTPWSSLHLPYSPFFILFKAEAVFFFNKKIEFLGNGHIDFVVHFFQRGLSDRIVPAVCRPVRINGTPFRSDDQG